jgi:hypothetical protein
MDLTTNSAIVEDELGLEHHGTKGMKWGVWNAETRARYVGMPRRAGKALQVSLKSAGASVAKGASAIKNKTSAKVSEQRASRKQAKAEKKERKKEIAEQRKELGMTRVEYDRLRERTLKSHDPRVVERGMHTLTDSELNAKIDRLRREESISNMAANKTANIQRERKARSEAIKANPIYGLGKDILYKKLGLKGDKKKDNDGNNTDNDKKADTNKDKKADDVKDTSKESSSSTRKADSLEGRQSQTYSTPGYKEKVRKAVKKSVIDSSLSSDSAKSAATRGQRLLTDGSVRAEVISVETIAPNSLALVPRRG